VSSRQQSIVQREMRKQADPLTKDGIIGAFCRTYSIEEAIAAFLPDVYQPSAMQGRYDYVPADSQAGVVIYEGKFAYTRIRYIGNFGFDVPHCSAGRTEVSA